MAKLLINCTHGREDAERATLSFVVGNVAASADQEVVVLLTIDGVWNATKGYADEICKEGFQPLKDVMQSFIANGGQILDLWSLCKAARDQRGRLDPRSADRQRCECRRVPGIRGGFTQFLMHLMVLTARPWRFPKTSRVFLK